MRSSEKNKIKRFSYFWVISYAHSWDGPDLSQLEATSPRPPAVSHQIPERLSREQCGVTGVHTGPQGTCQPRFRGEGYHSNS